MRCMQRQISQEAYQPGRKGHLPTQPAVCQSTRLRDWQAKPCMHRHAYPAKWDKKAPAVHDKEISSQQLVKDDRQKLSGLNKRQLLFSLPTSLWMTSYSAQAYVDPTTLDPATACCDDTAFVKHIDEEGIFSCLVPVGWTRVKKLDRSGGILGSWFNPYEPGAETLAIYRTPVPGINDTLGLGTAEDQGKALASVAPNSLLLDYEEYQDDGGKRYYTCCVEFDGSSAGRFGAAIEFRNVCAKDGYKYTLRITTTRYRFLSFQPVKDELQRVVQSYRLLI